MDSHAASHPHGAPRRVSQDPHSFCRHAPSPLTPGSLMRACARCFRTSCRLHHRRQTGRCHWFHEAESGSLTLGSRLCSRSLLATRPAGRRTDPFRAVGCPSAPGRSYMVNEQFTWLTPRSQRERVGLPWRNRRHDDTTTRRKPRYCESLRRIASRWWRRASRGGRSEVEWITSSRLFAALLVIHSTSLLQRRPAGPARRQRGSR